MRRVTGPSGGTTSGFDDTSVQVAKFRFNGGTMMLTKATADTTGAGWDTTAGRAQRLYRTSELGTSGTINKIGFRLDTAAASDYTDFKVVIEQVDITVLGGTFSGNLTGAAQTVYSGALSIPATAKDGDWIEIPLTSPIAYDSTKNLLVEYSSAGGTVSNILRWNSDAALYANRGLFHATSNIVDAGTLSSGIPDLVLYYTK